MKQAERFVFTDYSISKDSNTVIFRYRVDFTDKTKETFEEKLILPKATPHKITDNTAQKILRNLHLIIGISYYKLFLPREIVLENNFLDSQSAEFWNSVYTKGLGEFFYKNKIDYRGLVKFPFLSSQPINVRLATSQDVAGMDSFGQQDGRGSDKSDEDDKKSVLVGIGGGKDSILVADMLKKAGYEIQTTYKKNPIMESVAKLFSESPLEVWRELDTKMLQLSETNEVYNGHIPISAIYAFVLILYGYLYDYRFAVVGNEKSSNYGSIKYLDEEINHQWSKSKEFEDLFSDYIKLSVSEVQVEYFSLLRPFYEIEIVKRFCELPQYFHIFSSCNRNFKIIDPQLDKLWCGECPKCAFVYSLMAAFLQKEKLSAIFGENLFAKESLLDSYRELLGIKAIKPFDCVGTPEEVKTAFYMASQKGEYKDDVIMKMFESEVLPNLNRIEELKKEVFSYGDDSNIPEQFRAVLK